MNKKVLKQAAVDIKGGKCIVCGYKRCLTALHFHHIDKFLKEIDISKCSTWEQVEHELSKCVLLCANCHAEAHSGLIDLEFLIGLDEDFSR